MYSSSARRFRPISLDTSFHNRVVIERISSKNVTDNGSTIFVVIFNSTHENIVLETRGFPSSFYSRFFAKIFRENRAAGGDDNGWGGEGIGRRRKYNIRSAAPSCRSASLPTPINLPARTAPRHRRSYFCTIAPVLLSSRRCTVVVVVVVVVLFRTRVYFYTARRLYKFSFLFLFPVVAAAAVAAVAGPFVFARAPPALLVPRAPDRLDGISRGLASFTKLLPPLAAQSRIPPASRTTRLYNIRITLIRFRPRPPQTDLTPRHDDNGTLSISSYM